ELLFRDRKLENEYLQLYRQYLDLLHELREIKRILYKDTFLKSVGKQKKTLAVYKKKGKKQKV
ncbi:hypothetical protein EBU95_21125, partial [bacterium]|nr:hypothetical protein [bacterium]